MKRTICSRILAGLTSVMMSVIPFADSTAVTAKETTEPVTELTDGMSVKASGGIGTLLASTIQEQEELQDSGTGCNVLSVEMDGTTASVTYQTTDDCTLILAVYDDTGTELLGTGSKEVTVEESNTQLDISIDSMPEYFYIRAYLVDAMSAAPMSMVYECPNYTKEMQEFFRKTTEDFPEERVINFDDDETNNFGVYDEKVRIIPYAEGVNTVVSADDEKMIYVLENADEQILSLQKGDIFTYAYGDEECLIVNVDSVKADGTTVTIQGADLESSDVFEFLRIEQTYGLEDADIEPAEGVEVVYSDGTDLAASASSDTPDPVEIHNKCTLKKKFLGKEWKTEPADGFAPKTYGKVNAEVKLEGDVSISIDTSLKLYISSKNMYCELSVGLEAGVEIKVSGELEFAYTFATVPIQTGVPGLLVELRPTLVLRFNASVTLSAKVSTTQGVRVGLVNGKFKCENLSSAPKVTAGLEIEGSVFIGFDLNPHLTLLNAKFLSIGISGEAGVELTAKLDLTSSYDPFTDVYTIHNMHSCDKCIDGDILFKFELSVNATIFGKTYSTKQHKDVADKTKSTDNKLSLKKEHKLGDFYYSIDHKEFGWGECPHQIYQVSVIFKNEAGEKLSDVAVKFDKPVYILSDPEKKVETTEFTTDKNGKIIFWAPVGKHEFTYQADGYPTGKDSFKVKLKDGSLKKKSMTVTVTQNTAPHTGVDDLSDIIPRQVCAGDEFVYFIDQNDALYACKNPHEKPVRVMDNVKTVFSNGCTIALTNDGELYRWVENGTDPPVKKMDHVKSMKGGINFSDDVAVITEDGTLYMWGSYHFWMDYNESTVNGTEPYKIMENVEDAWVGFNEGAALTEDGDLYTFGEKLGNGTTERSYTPVKILSHIQSAALGDVHGAAIGDDGSLYVWGDNREGSVGIEDWKSQTMVTVPEKIMVQVTKVSLGKQVSGALTEAGDLYTWGENFDGQAGIDSSPLFEIYTPQKIMENVVDFDIFYQVGAALTEDGKLYTWGNNSSGATGSGKDNYIQTTPGLVLENVTAYDSNGGITVAATTDGSVYMWGAGKYYTPEKIEFASGQSTPDIDTTNPSAVSAGTGEKTVTLTGLLPDTVCNFYVMRSRDAEKPFSADNLLYIAQGTADSTGSAGFTYVPLADDTDAEVFAVSMEPSIGNAVISVPELSTSGEAVTPEPIVTLGGRRLVRDTDYTLSGDTSVSEPGIYQLTITGIGEYSGFMKTSYAVDEAEPVSDSPGDVNGDGAINAKDATLILIAAAKIGAGNPSGMTAEQETAGDVNGDSIINAKDATIVLRYAASVGAGRDVKLSDFV